MLGGNPANVNHKKSGVYVTRSRDLSLPDDPLDAAGIRFYDRSPRSESFLTSGLMRYTGA